jgi:hypothetical protein
MSMKALPTSVRPGGPKNDENGNSTDPADWQAAILGIATEFGKVAADNLKRDEVRQQEQALANPPFNWKPWAIGGGLLVGGLVLLKVLKVF